MYFEKPYRLFCWDLVGKWRVQALKEKSRVRVMPDFLSLEGVPGELKLWRKQQARVCYADHMGQCDRHHEFDVPSLRNVRVMMFFALALNDQEAVDVLRHFHKLALNPEEEFAFLTSERVPKSRTSPTDMILSLLDLKEGWLDGAGIAYSEDRVQKIYLAWKDLEDRIDKDTPPVYIYPTPEGGVSFEWDIGRRSVTVEYVLEVLVDGNLQGTYDFLVLNKDSGMMMARNGMDARLTAEMIDATEG